MRRSHLCLSMLALGLLAAGFPGSEARVLGLLVAVLGLAGCVLVFLAGDGDGTLPIKPD